MSLNPDSTQRIGESIVKEIVLSLCTGIHCVSHDMIRERGLAQLPATLNQMRKDDGDEIKQLITSIVWFTNK